MIRRSLFRVDPVVGPEHYTTYGVASPISTHTREATCAEVECANHRNGFQITADVSTALGRKQAEYIRLHSGRHFTVEQSGDLVAFTFPAGQRCFAQHRVSLHREPIFSKRGGDYRGNPLGVRRTVMRPEDWRDDFGEHQLKVAEAKERG